MEWMIREKVTFSKHMRINWQLLRFLPKNGYQIPNGLLWSEYIEGQHCRHVQTENFSIFFARLNLHQIFKQHFYLIHSIIDQARSEASLMFNENEMNPPS